MMIVSTNKNTSYKIIKKGGIPSTFKEDGIIASYIKELRNNSIPVSTTDVILYAKEIVVMLSKKDLLYLSEVGLSVLLKEWVFLFLL